MADPSKGGLQPGDEVAGYKLERRIGHGGMGTVWEATQRSLARPVALKLISSELAESESFRARFRSEAQAAASIEHPNMLPIYETGEVGTGLFIAMRLISGPDLGTFLRGRSRLGPREAVDILRQVAEALDAAHERGVIHRDVKPGNVLLEEHRDGLRAYVSDFGLSKRVEGGPRHTETGVLLGTVDYMAPEQIEGGDIDTRVDIYAFGCLVYACLVGEPPFKRDSRGATLMAHANAPVPAPSERVVGTPRALDVVVQRAMAKNRDERARSAGSLMRWAAEQLASTGARPAFEPDPTRPIARTRRFGVALAVHTVLYAPLFAGAFLLGRQL